jgi:murein DD-endopeptidase MepM/ murein hydrolase activator NlpD
VKLDAPFLLLPIAFAVAACNVRPPAVGPEEEALREQPWRREVMVWPVRGTIVSPYRATSRPDHKGVDLAAPAGTLVVAALGGQAMFSGGVAGFGSVVALRHERGLTTIYAHLGETHVGAGEPVAKGQAIGRIGSSGYLHYEIREAKEPMDPAEFYASVPRVQEGVAAVHDVEVSAEPTTAVPVPPPPPSLASGLVFHPFSSTPQPSVVPEAPTPLPTLEPLPASPLSTLERFPTTEPFPTPEPFPTAEPLPTAAATPPPLPALPTPLPTPTWRMPPSAPPTPETRAPSPLPFPIPTHPFPPPPPRFPTSAPAQPAGASTGTISRLPDADDAHPQARSGAQERSGSRTPASAARGSAPEARSGWTTAALIGANVLYVPAKLAYAAVGGVTGGFVLVLSHDPDVARKFWSQTLGGDYLVTEEHLHGDRPLRFIGRPDEL